MVAEWLHALHGWEVAALIRRSVFIYPFLNATHIFALALLIGTIIPADLKLLGLFPAIPTGPFLRLMTTISAAGLALAVGTGFLLFSVQPLEYAANPAFLTKLGLVGVGTVNASVVRFSPGWRSVQTHGISSTGLRIAAVLSITIWIAALLAGRWIAFL